MMTNIDCRIMLHYSIHTVTTSVPKQLLTGSHSTECQIHAEYQNVMIFDKDVALYLKNSAKQRLLLLNFD